MKISYREILHSRCAVIQTSSVIFVSNLPFDKYLDIFELKSTKFICVIWNHMKIHCIGLKVVDMFDQARLKLRRARVSITSTEGMVVGAVSVV